MNRAELSAHLQAIGVTEHAYSLDGGHKEDSFCLDKRAGGWVVYYSERGRESSIATWLAEDDACADLLARVTSSAHAFLSMVVGPAPAAAADAAFDRWLAQRGTSRAALSSEEWTYDDVPFTTASYARRYFVRNTTIRRLSVSSTPAGWYADGRGGLAWWDGTCWTGAVAERPVDRTWAVLAHVSLFVFTIVAPLVILLTAGRTDRYTKHHASEALNAQIWFAIVWNLIFGGFFVSAIVASQPPVWVFVVLPVAGALFVGFAVLAILGAVRAARGELWRYPLPFRFVKGAAPR